VMLPLRELERVEWRVLGALRFVDATTGVPVERTLHVDAPGASLLRNRSGLYVIRRWNALSAHEAQFLAPPLVPAPGSQSLGISVSDPAGGYLPVTARIRLPRTGDLAQAADPASLFLPAVVPLYPSASAPVGVNWAVLRVSLPKPPVATRLVVRCCAYSSMATCSRAVSPIGAEKHWSRWWAYP